MGLFSKGQDPTSGMTKLGNTARGAAEFGRDAEFNYLNSGPRTQYEQNMNLQTGHRLGGNGFQNMAEAKSARGLGRAFDTLQGATRGSRAMTDLANNYRNIAMGSAPTAAESLGQAQMQNASRQIMDTAARAGAMNPSAQRAAAYASQGVMPGMAAQIAGLAGQERMQAGQLGGELAMRNAMLAQQAANSLGGLAGSAQTTAANLDSNYLNAMRTNYLDMMNARKMAEDQVLAPYIQSMAPAAGNYGTAVGLSKDLLGMGMNGAGGLAQGLGMLFMSDETKKENIEEGDDKVKDFLSKITAYEYEYKPEVKGLPIAPKGRHLSVMAQDLEKSRIGKEAVHDTKVGKVVNYGKLAPAMLASLASINKRLEKIEGK